jgi:hypothetical protein
MPAVNIPSKKNDSIELGKISEVNPPKKIESKNPTQVAVHNVQLIKSPKNFDLVLINSLVLSKIEPHTMIDVIPYAMNDHNNSLSIIFFKI